MNNNLKHKVGDNVRIITQYNRGIYEDKHGFKIGQIVTIKEILKSSSFDYMADLKDDFWFIDESDCEPIETTKIKGYRLKEDCYKYRDVLLKIWETNGEVLVWATNCIIAVKYANILIKEGVGHWIEPVYEGETVIIKMSCKDKNGNDDIFEIEVSKKGIYYKPERAWLNALNIRNMCFRGQIGVHECEERKFYNFKPSIIDIGCKLSTLVSDWEKVLSEHERILKG